MRWSWQFLTYRRTACRMGGWRETALAATLGTGCRRWCCEWIEGIPQFLRTPRQLLQLVLLPLLIGLLRTFLAVRLLGRQQVIHHPCNLVRRRDNRLLWPQ